MSEKISDDLMARAIAIATSLQKMRMLRILDRQTNLLRDGQKQQVVELHPVTNEDVQNVLSMLQNVFDQAMHHAVWRVIQDVDEVSNAKPIDKKQLARLEKIVEDLKKEMHISYHVAGPGKMEVRVK